MARFVLEDEAPAKAPGRSRFVVEEDAIDPTAGMSTTQKAVAGLGKSFVDTYQGIKQLGASAGNTLGLVSDETVQAIQAEQDERHALDKPLMSTGAGLAGNIGGQVLQIALPGSALGKVGAVKNALQVVGKAAPYARAAAAGGTFAATQPVLSDDTRLGNAATGVAFGAAGQGVANALGTVARGASDRLSPAVKALAQRADELGIPVNVAQLGDSKFVKTLQSTLERLPFTGAGQARQGQQEAFNRAVSRTFGEDSPVVTREVYAAAKGRIGGEFERLSANNSLAMSDELLGKLLATQDEAARFAGGDTAMAVRSAVNELLSKADSAGNIPGRAYQAFDSQVGKIMKTGGEKAMFLGQLRDAVRGAMDDSIAPADKAAWQTARQQYKALKTVRDLVAKEGADGNISPALLMGRMNASQAGKEAMASGRGGDLGDLAQIGRQFVRDPIPDSGTANRLLALGALGGGGYAVGLDPTTTLAVLGGGATLGRGANALMQSNALRNYLMNGGGRVGNALAQIGRPAPLLLPASANALDQ